MSIPVFMCQIKNSLSLLYNRNYMENLTNKICKQLHFALQNVKLFYHRIHYKL